MKARSQATASLSRQSEQLLIHPLGELLNWLDGASSTRTDGFKGLRSEKGAGDLATWDLSQITGQVISPLYGPSYP